MWVTLFIDCGWVTLFIAGNYSDSNIFLFYSFFHSFLKVSKQDTLFARN